VAVVFSISPGHAQTDLGHAAIRDRADVGSLAARVNADAIATLCGNIKAARPTLTPHPCAVVPGAHNLRVHPVTSRSGAPKVGDVRYRKRGDPGNAVTPIFVTLPPTANSLSLPRRATMQPYLLQRNPRHRGHRPGLHFARTLSTMPFASFCNATKTQPALQ
jgi:hypothetical protein